MKHCFLRNFLCTGFLAGLILIQGSAHAYELTALGAAGGWDDINKQPLITTVIDYGDLTTDIDVKLVEAAIISGYDTWDSVDAAVNLNFYFKDGSDGNYDVFDSNGADWFDGTSATLDQDANWRYANIVMGGWLDEEYFLNLDPVNGANILAVTWTGKLSGDGSRKPAWHSEIFFNDGWDWTDDLTTCGGCIDIETVFVHELGHAIGFGHENVVPSVMASYYTGEQRDLFQTDIDGAVALYSNPLKGSGGGNKGGGRGGKKNKLSALEADFIVTVPEPGSLAMFGFGLAVLGFMRRRRPARA